MNEALQFLSDHRDAAIGVVSAFVALIGAFMASGETRKQRGLLQETLRQRLDGASIKWGDEAIDALAAAEGLARHPESTTYRADLEHPTLKNVPKHKIRKLRFRGHVHLFSMRWSMRIKSLSV